MALSIQEQLSILKGDIQPPSSKLLEVVHQVAVNCALDFYEDYKTFDEQANANAKSYVTKMLRIGNLVLTNQKGIIENLKRVIITIYGRTGDYNVVENATNAQWANFLQSTMIEAFERLVSITRTEKTAYDDLP